MKASDVEAIKIRNNDTKITNGFANTISTNHDKKQFRSIFPTRDLSQKSDKAIKVYTSTSIDSMYVNSIVVKDITSSI